MTELLRKVVIEPEDLVAADRLGEAFHLDRGLLLDRHIVPYQGIGLVTEQDAVDFRMRLEPRGQFTALPMIVWSMRSSLPKLPTVQ